LYILPEDGLWGQIHVVEIKIKNKHLENIVARGGTSKKP
jgi:hypothetical protein